MINAHNEDRNDDTEHDQEFHDVHGGTERKGIYKQVAFYYKMTQLKSDMSTLGKLSQWPSLFPDSIMIESLFNCLHKYLIRRI